MTITNLGGISGTIFTPIVTLNLSYDHRAINGADAARFCKKYATLLEEPRSMLL